MRILLDECVDQRLRRDLDGHDVSTVQECRWTGKKNGELLRLAREQFYAFVTVDRNLRFQQNLPKFNIAGIYTVLSNQSFFRFAVSDSPASSGIIDGEK